MASFSVRFLGCKVSQTDAQAVRERLVRDGHREVEASGESSGDVAVVNTCCVTNEGLAKSRQAASRAARTHARVYVTGCGARLSDTAFAGLPENVTVVPGQIEQAVETVAGDVGAIGCVQADARLDRVRAFVKIQDGCSFSCAFCVIPLVRGATRSRSAEAVLGEIRRRVAQGHREIVLTGASIAAKEGRADFAPYAASKAAVLSLTWSSAVRLAPEQIRVNALCPAAVDTEFWQRIENIKQEQGAEPGATRAARAAAIPLGRFAFPREVAAAALYLCSDDAAFVTGTSIDLTGAAHTGS